MWAICWYLNKSGKYAYFQNAHLYCDYYMKTNRAIKLKESAHNKNWFTSKRELELFLLAPIHIHIHVHTLKHMFSFINRANEEINARLIKLNTRKCAWNETCIAQTIILFCQTKQNQAAQKGRKRERRENKTKIISTPRQYEELVDRALTKQANTDRYKHTHKIRKWP